MKKRIPTTMGIVIILTYTFFLAVPLFVLWRSIISSETVSFSSIKYSPTKNITENNKKEESLLNIINDNVEKSLADVE